MNDARGRLARIARWIGVATLAVLVLGLGCWGTLLLAFAGPGSDVVHGALVLGFALASAAFINARAKAADSALDFSQRIRAAD
jgi:hypothetical protein